MLLISLWFAVMSCTLIDLNWSKTKRTGLDWIGRVRRRLKESYHHLEISCWRRPINVLVHPSVVPILPAIIACIQTPSEIAYKNGPWGRQIELIYILVLLHLYTSGPTSIFKYEPYGRKRDLNFPLSHWYGTKHYTVLYEVYNVLRLGPFVFILTNNRPGLAN